MNLRASGKWQSRFSVPSYTLGNSRVGGHTCGEKMVTLNKHLFLSQIKAKLSWQSVKTGWVGSQSYSGRLGLESKKGNGRRKPIKFEGHISGQIYAKTCAISLLNDYATNWATKCVWGGLKQRQDRNDSGEGRSENFCPKDRNPIHFGLSFCFSPKSLLERGTNQRQGKERVELKCTEWIGKASSEPSLCFDKFIFLPHILSYFDEGGLWK